MKQLKGFLIVICGFFILLSLVSLLMPSQVTMVRSVMIKGELPAITANINDLQQWRKWHPVFGDSSVDKIISVPSAGVGATARWKSASGENTLSIDTVHPRQTQLTLTRRGEEKILQYFSFQQVAGNPGWQVEWRMHTRVSWLPWEKFAGMFFDNMVGPGCEQALNQLKNVVEKP